MAPRDGQVTSAAIPPRLLITRRVPAEVIEHARGRFTTQVWNDDRPLGDLFVDRAKGYDALMIMANDRFDAVAIDALRPTLRAVATYSVGHEHIDLAAATRAGLPVCNAPDALNEAVAEIALYLILAAARRTRRAEHALRTGDWPPWSPSFMVGMQLTGKRLGIYGMGAIGREIAVRARAFGMAIHYFNRQRLAPELEQRATYHATLESLLGVSEVLCVAAPSTPQTRSSLDRARLLLLPPGAIVVNIARGDLIDEDALIELVRQDRLGPVGLDVFRNEPRIDPRLKDLPEAVLLPHIGSATTQARIAMGLRALQGLEQHFCGALPENCLNIEAYAPPSRT